MHLKLLSMSAAGAAQLLLHKGGMVSMAQTKAAIGDEVAAADQVPEPLGTEEMEILVARVALWPARHAETGVSTFVISHDGILHDKDLGPDTEKLAGESPASTLTAVGKSRETRRRGPIARQMN
jgi:hypothetical protein